MTQAAFSHISLNVSDLAASSKFYINALSPLDFTVADSAKDYVRLTNGSNFVIVLSPVEPKHQRRAYHRKAVGLGHLAISVTSREIVDRMEDHLHGLGITALGDGKVELGYRRGYYCFLFEDPDKIMIEIAYHDPFYFYGNHHDKNPMPKKWLQVLS